MKDQTMLNSQRQKGKKIFADHRADKNHNIKGAMKQGWGMCATFQSFKYIPLNGPLNRPWYVHVPNRPLNRPRYVHVPRSVQLQTDQNRPRYVRP